MSDVLAAAKGFLYTSFAPNLWWMLKSVITFVFMTGGIINLLISFNGSFSPSTISTRIVVFAIWRDIAARQRGAAEHTAITVCHTGLRYSSLQTMAEIKYSPLGKGQVANNSRWPLSKNARSQPPLVTSSYILPGGPKQALPRSLRHGELTPGVLTRCARSLSVRVLTATLPWQNVLE